MPPGPKPRNGTALTGAERQARYRERHATAPVVRHRRPADRRSRPQRWHDAVAALVALQEAYGAWLEALPEASRDGATGEALQAVVDLDLGDILAMLPAARSCVKMAESAGDREGRFGGGHVGGVGQNGGSSSRSGWSGCVAWGWYSSRAASMSWVA
jgi:hypothetical protein